MAKLLVYLDDEDHESLKELAHRNKTTMAALVRYAIDKTFEDELDALNSQRGWEEYLRDPSSAISLEDLMKEMGIALPERRRKKGREGAPSDASGRSAEDFSGHQLAGG